MKVKGKYEGQAIFLGSDYKPRKIWVDNNEMAPFNFDWGEDSGWKGDILAQVICKIDPTKNIQAVREAIDKLPKSDFEIDL